MESTALNHDSHNAVQVRVDGPCGTIVLRRPTRQNAITPQMVLQLRQALDDLHRQRSVRAVLLTGAGNAFSTGTDLHELQQSMSASDRHRLWQDEIQQFCNLLTDMLRFPKPLIAGVNGVALGSGLALVAACDIVLSSPDALFGSPEASWGLSASMTVPLLHFRMGASGAARCLFAGQRISADEALRWGLVHEIVPFDLLWARAHAMASNVSRESFIAVSLTKRILNESVGELVSTQLAAAAAAAASARTTDDARIGIDAFVQKQTPSW